MQFLPLLEAKRDGAVLSAEQIQFFISQVVGGHLPDYQIASFLMAIFFRGLSGDELRALTIAMRDSGETLHFPDDPRPLVDKHSTGGVGDKVSLVLAPLLASLGFRVPMISGRGLGITGGTLDKLESIPGFRTALDPSEIVRIVQEVGCVICGQTDAMVPADRKLYALRDVTGTVPSVPLITASILSKKLAEGIGALLLDVKFGRAAFMKSQDDARALAITMTEMAAKLGLKSRALLTNMDRPLGRAVGNWLEIKEAVNCLDCRGPEDLQDLVLTSAAHLLLMMGKVNQFDAAYRIAATSLSSGEPRRVWDRMIVAQGSDPAAFQRKFFETAPVVLELEASQDGFVSDINARLVGEIVRDLGGGRLRADDRIDAMAGLDELVTIGEVVGPGSILARVHARTEQEAEAALYRLGNVFRFTEEPCDDSPLVSETIGF